MTHLQPQHPAQRRAQAVLRVSRETKERTRLDRWEVAFVCMSSMSNVDGTGVRQGRKQSNRFSGKLHANYTMLLGEVDGPELTERTPGGEVTRGAG